MKFADYPQREEMLFFTSAIFSVIAELKMKMWMILMMKKKKVKMWMMLMMKKKMKKVKQSPTKAIPPPSGASC